MHACILTCKEVTSCKHKRTHRQLLLALAEKLCSEYGTDALSKKLVDSIHLFIVPSMNPDGFKMRRRESP